jgi:phosphate transport system substrate-binding protein
MNKLVLKGAKIIEGGDRMLIGMAGPIDAIAKTPNGIAYSVYYYEHIMSPRAENRLLAVNGITPTADTLWGGTYPLRAPVYVVTRKNLPPDSAAARLRDWLLSPAGQELVSQSGYVALR